MRLRRVRNAFSFPGRSNLRGSSSFPYGLSRDGGYLVDFRRETSWFSFSRKGPEFLERLCRLAARLGVENQQMLPTGMGHIEAGSVEIKLANSGMTQMDDAGPVPDICARPQLAEALTGSCELVDQLLQPRITLIAPDNIA